MSSAQLIGFFEVTQSPKVEILEMQPGRVKTVSPRHSA